jgi:hypothetical protein
MWPRAGNQDMQRLLRSGAIHAKSAISQPGDPEEREADAVTHRIMRAKSGDQATCSCAGSNEGICEECAAKAPIARKATDAGRTASPSSHRGIDTIVRSPGRRLNPATRAFFEPRFGRSFADVRVHTDADAAASARSIQARAYAVGEHIVFDSGQFAPESEQGQRLIAHELTHVAQHDDSGSPVVHRDLDPTLSITMTPEYAHDLSDAELDREEAALSGRLRELDDEAFDDYLDEPGTATNVSPEWDAVAANLRILRDEKNRRTEGAGIEEIGEVPRPVGLPLDQGFQLQEAPEEYQGLAGQIPDGQLIDVVVMPPSNQSSGPPLTRYGAPVGAAGAALNASVNAQVMATGFATDVENSIVLVANPRFWTQGNRIPQTTTILGHTAVGARVDGQLVTIRGLSPDKLALMGDWSAASGESAVPSVITEDLSLLKNTTAMTLEYPVTREVAQAFAQGLPQPGPFGPPGPMWTGVPAEFGNVCTGQNCVLWATQQAESALGGRIGPVGGPPIADVPQVAQGGQGQLIGFMKNAAKGTQDVAPVESAIEPAVVAGMPTGLKILKWGGRVMFVLGLFGVAAEIYFAPEGERARTAVGASGGFVGGLAAGAAAGLVCGPGALACSIVLGLGFGIVGALGGRALAEGIFDFFGAQKMTPAEFINTSTLMFGTPDEIRKMCELREIENPDLAEYDPMCGKIY